MKKNVIVKRNFNITENFSFIFHLFSLMQINLITNMFFLEIFDRYSLLLNFHKISFLIAYQRNNKQYAIKANFTYWFFDIFFN